MYDVKRIEALRFIAQLTAVFLMVFTLIIRVAAFNALLHIFLCSLILLLITVILVFDGILKDGKIMFTHGVWYAIWLLSIIITLLKISM